MRFRDRYPVAALLRPDTPDPLVRVDPAPGTRGLLPFKVPVLLFAVFGYGPTAAGLIMPALERGKPGGRDMLRRLGRWRVGIGWYVWTLVSTGVILSAVLWRYGSIQGAPVSVQWGDLLAKLLPTLPISIVLGGPLSQELVCLRSSITPRSIPRRNWWWLPCRSPETRRFFS